jgi:hypothetical protein
MAGGMAVRRRLHVAAVMAVTLAASLVTVAPSASAAVQLGHDVSWPQCPSSLGGYDLPMPPTATQFVVIGLTKGLPFTENPCLASQVGWAKTNNVPAHGYAMAAFPTAAQLSTYGGSGPWSGSTRAGRISNAGYAAAAFAAASMTKVGFAPSVVWIDVEPRTNQPWPTGSVAQRENRLVIEGLMRGLRDAGFSYGLYSYANGWSQITGGWWLPGVPVWATAGRLDYPTEAAEMCTKPSFSGGRVYLAQWYDSTRDYDRTCDPYQFGPIPRPPSTTPAADFDGDVNADLLARVKTTGEVRLYPGNGRGSWLPRTTVATGWQGFDTVDAVGDFDGDGASDLLARDPASGNLLLYPGDGSGGLLPSRRVGTGWNVMDAIVGVGDFTGDQRNDVLARRAATGALWLYPGNGAGGWLSARQVGTGWSIMSALIAPGDFNGDGAVDLLARRASTGSLYLYPGDGAGGWLSPVRYGTGWNAMSALVSPGDFDGDRAPDLLAREAATGRLLLYRGNGVGGWRAMTPIGVGWGGFDAIF